MRLNGFSTYTSLPGIACVNELQRVPMVRRCDHDGIDILVVEEFSIFLVFLRCAARFSSGEFHVIFAQITDSDCLGITMFQKCFVDLVSTVADPDVSHPNPVIRAKDA